MSIKINKLVHSVYEDEISYNVEIEVTNTGEAPIESVQSYSVLLNNEGQPLISEESDQEEYIDPDGAAEITLYLGSVPKDLVDAENVSVKVMSHLCSIVFQELPSLSITDAPLEYIKADIDEPIKVAEVLEVTNICAWVNKTDEEGESAVTVKVAVRNLTNEHVSKCKIKVRLTASNGRELSESEMDEQIKRNGEKLIDCSLWGVSPKQLNGAKLLLSIACYPTVKTVSAEHAGSSLDEY
jgi:hypothetical protein